MINKNLLKKAGVFACAFALVFTSMQVRAEEMSKQDVQVESVEMQSGEELALPSLISNTLTWDGGLLEIPFDAGDYEIDRAAFSIRSGDTTRFIWLDVSDGKLIGTLNDVFDRCEKGMFFTEAGTYSGQVNFYVDNTQISTEEISLEVASSSTMWNVTRETVKFDGSQDVVFHFTNGTNHCELKEINKIDIFVGMGVETPDLIKGEFTYDLNAGTVTIAKETLKSFLTTYAYAPEVLGVNVYVTTEAGELKQRFNNVSYQGGDPYMTDTAWHLDTTDFNPVVEEPSGEFAGTSSGDVEVSQETGNQIAKSALAYIQKNYADKVSALGDDYTVVSNLECKSLAEVNDDVKEKFADALNGTSVGQYYDISVKASVLKDGQVISGLENVNVPQLDEKITIRVKIPENLKKIGRTYAMLHYHNGKVENLSTVVEEDELLVQTASFSPYLLTYKDAASSENLPAGGGASKTGAPETGDFTNVWVLVFSIGLSIVAIGSIVYKKERLYK